MAEILNAYLFVGEAYMAGRSLSALKQKCGIENEQLNITVFEAFPGVDALMAACDAVPLMSPRRMVVLKDDVILSGKGSKTNGAALAEYLDHIPDTTVLVLMPGGAVDKRKALYKKIAKGGGAKEFSQPKPAEAAAFASRLAAQKGKTLPADAAALLVQISGCDYYTLTGEVAKLAVFADEGRITGAHVRACASKSLEYNIFELHEMLAKRQAQAARSLLEDVMQRERPEALVGLFARKVRDMYKTKAMSEAGYNTAKIAAQLKIPSFAARRLAGECARFSKTHLIDSLRRLGELDHDMKSGRADAFLALPAVLFWIYEL